MQRDRFLLAAMLAIVLVGCKKEEPVEAPDLGYDYFPRVVGQWIEYQVDSTWRDDPSAVSGSVSYRLLEKVVQTYTDDEGRLCYMIHRFVKDDLDNWVVRDVWTSTRSNTAAESTEENLRLMKLVFPVNNGTDWDINVFNTEDELEVAFREKGSAWSAGTLSFANTVLVKNTVPANVIEKRNFEERYANGVGMVSKYREETNTQFNQQAQMWQVTGWRLDMVAVAYGAD